jgi:D-alanyl-lipoteichoic acid acyltransferase DltB (MBOAT superfamily)
MNFISTEFILFFSVVFSLYFLVPAKIKWLYLLAASLFFYGYYNLFNLALLLIPTVIVYFIGRGLDKSESPERRKWLLVGGLIASLAVLVVFKYTNFIMGSMYSLLGMWKPDLTFKPYDLAFTIGISFFTFKLVSYLIDVYREHMPAERHIGYFTLYVSFFPQLFMGPIDRAIKFIPELKKRVAFDGARIASGVQLVAWGVFKKMVVADRLAMFVDQMFAQPQGQGLYLIFGTYFYAIQIYCDFSGYTDIAIGIARMLGFKSMKNFDYPYDAKNITGFWNRWHISLSTWLRDYLFLPIAYAVMRRIEGPKLWNIKVEAWGYAVGMFITMFLGGLWHGASWTFVIWGMLHGVYLVISFTTKKKRKRLVKKMGLNKRPKLHHAMQVFITFNMLAITWIFFRAQSLESAYTYIKYLQLKLPETGHVFFLFNLLTAAAFLLMEAIYKRRSKLSFWVRMPRPVRIALFALFICIIIIFSVDTTNEFIYFQF